MTENQSTDAERDLAGVGGDDVSAGTSVSGVGGEATRMENDDAGLSSVAERAARVGWGRNVAVGDHPVASHDESGQSEKPAE